ncbi:hypothetical protein [Gemmobacter caeruleus]|uniref:hypothetical protein n=1 Tax=Gemmobacter caeruleus TaxID=2595004 RepID=UPI0011EBCCF9|nr:hypothetical protein [Gemmobacter caeruleus]
MTTPQVIMWRGGALISLCISALMLVAAIQRRPRLTWNENEISFVALIGLSSRSYRLAEFGPVMPYTSYGSHRQRVLNCLVFRPLSGGKAQIVGLPDTRLTESELAALAAEINRARGLPPGAADPEAVTEVNGRFSGNIIALMIYAPILGVMAILLHSML